MKKNLLISFSGGQTSAYMTKWLLENKADEYNFIVVYANTGKEREETLEFIHECDLRWNFQTVWLETVMNERGVGASFKIVDFETASRNGEPFEAVIAKHGIPNRNTPHCSRELKARAIEAYAKSIGWKGYTTAIGIRADEPSRVSRGKQKAQNIIYPLVDFHPVAKSWISQWWKQQPFNLGLKNYEGNCDLCWKKNIKKHITIINEAPERIKWWEDMENKYEYFTPAGRANNPTVKPPHRFFRENRSCADLKKMSEKVFGAGDNEEKEVYRQLLLYGNYEMTDETNECEESCEAI